MRLYQPSNSLSADDYDILLREAIGKRRILEFGPGHSTYAWIEAGCEVVSLENHDGWRAEKVEEFNMYPQVHIGKYEDTAPKATVSTLVDTHGPFDLALVDSPRGNWVRKKHDEFPDCSRLNTALAALDLAPVILLHDTARSGERNTLNYLERLGHKVEHLVAPPVWGKRLYSYGIARVTRDGNQIEGRPHKQDAEVPRCASVRAGG